MCGHSVSMIILLLDWKPLPPMHTKTFAINSYYGPTEDWPYPQGVIQMVGQLPLYNQPAYVRAVGARSLIAHCMTEEPSLKSVGLEFIGDEVSPQVRRAATPRKSLNRLAKRGRRIFREAGCRVVFTPRRRDVGWHGVGTARMGHDVRSSVVDPRCRVHGFEISTSSTPRRCPRREP